MHAVVFGRHGQPAEVRGGTGSASAPGGVVVRVGATGPCELAGVVQAVASAITGWQPETG